MFRGDPKLTDYQIFLQLGQETTVTPDSLLRETGDPDYQNAKDWYEVVEKLADIDSAKRDEILRKINKGIITAELAKPDNFPSPEIHQRYTEEEQRRSEEQATVDEREDK